jgi:predicted tellurium resistance membrane protein TerC
VNPWVAATIALVLLVAAVVVALLVLRFARRGLQRIGQYRPFRAQGDMF